MFVFDKKRFEAALTKTGVPRSSANEVYERLRREVASLTKLRHPFLLKLIHPLEESKNSIRFVAEPLFSSLKHMIDVNASNVGASALEGFELDELAIQKGLLQVSEALDFLHNTASSVHLDIQPSSVLINTKGDWKLFGLGFVESLKNGDASAKSEYFVPRFDGRLPPYIQVNFDFAAPELVLDHKLDPANDIFSLGALLITLFLSKPPMRTDNNSSVYKQEFQRIDRVLKDPRIPAYLHDLLPQMMARYPDNRINLSRLKSSPLFDNILIRTINFLDDFPAKLPAEQQAFMTGFSKLIEQFPKSVLQKKILPAFLEELGKEEVLVGPILTNIFIIGKDMSQLGFSEKILPAVRRVKDTLSAQVTVLNNIEILKSRVKGDEFRDDVLPIVLDAMENAPPEIQEVSLQKLPIYIEKLDFVTLKNEVFPKVGSVFAKTTSLAVKLEALKAFQQLVVSGLDKYAVTEKLLPLLASMKTREPSVMMGALAVYEKAVAHVEVETLARQVIPQLLNMSMESMLNLSQFKSFMGEIHKVLDRVEKDHAKRLSQVQVESSAIGSGNPIGSNGIGSKTEGGPSSFEDLVYGKKNVTSPTLADIPETARSSTSNDGFTSPKPLSISLSGSYAAGPKALNPLMPVTSPKPQSSSSFTNSSTNTISSSFGSLKLNSASKFKPLSPPPLTSPPINNTIIPSFGNGNSLSNSRNTSISNPVGGFGLTPATLSSAASVAETSLKTKPSVIDWSKSQRSTSNSGSAGLNPLNSTSSNNPLSSGGINWNMAIKPNNPASSSLNDSFGEFHSTSSTGNGSSSNSFGMSSNSFSTIAPLRPAGNLQPQSNSQGGFSLSGLTPLSPSTASTNNGGFGFGSTGGKSFSGNTGGGDSLI